MNLSEVEIIQRYGKLCWHCNRNTLLPYKYEFTCFSYHVNKRKHELSKILRKKNKFYQQIKTCSSQNIFHMFRCI